MTVWSGRWNESLRMCCSSDRNGPAARRLERVPSHTVSSGSVKRMLVIDDLEKLPEGLPYPVLTIGVFDGVHRGHAEILRTLVERAAAVQGSAVVLTFTPHPQKIISSGSAPLLLQTDRQKIECLEERGVDILVRLPFTRQMSLLPPDEFVKGILYHSGFREVFVGSNFRFGYRRSGDFDLLKRLGAGYGIEVKEIEQVKALGDRVSSTVIRRLLLEGRVAEAATMLGRPYELAGTVVRGDRRGAGLGFPTANLRVSNELVPEVGVYITQVVFDEKEMGAVTNIGFRPTLASRLSREPVVESHVLDLDADLYGKAMRVRFLERIRCEEKFAGVDELKAQIGRDVRAARRFWKEAHEDQARAG